MHYDDGQGGEAEAERSADNALAESSEPVVDGSLQIAAALRAVAYELRALRHSQSAGTAMLSGVLSDDPKVTALLRSWAESVRGGGTGR